MDAGIHSNAGSFRIPWLLATAMLVLGLLGTANFYRDQQRAAADTLQAGFTASTDRLYTNLDHRLRTFQAAMRGVQGFVLASDGITREEFQTYVNSLQMRDLLPGVQAIAFVEPLLPDQVPDHLARQRLAFSADYQILPAGERTRYTPIAYIEPFAENQDALGFDVLTNQAARAAMELSLTRGDIAITAKLMLVQDAGTNEVYSFVMYLPVFRPRVPLNTLAAREDALMGWVDVPFRMNDLMAGLAGEFSPDIYLEIHDGSPGTDTRMYYTAAANAQPGPDSLQLQRILPVAGREWTLVMRSTPGFEAGLVNPLQGPLILLSGGAVSVVLSLVLWMLANARYSAEFRYRRLFDNAGDGILVFERDYRLAAANPTALRLLGYGWEELRRLRVSDLVEVAQWPALDEAVRGLRQGDTHRGEWSHRDKNGYVFPAQVSISMLEGERYFSILRDMTQHRKAQERIHRLSQFYKALSATNHTILRRGDAAELFPAVCRIAVEYGGMTMAWVGQVDPESQWIHPVASAGRGLSYLEKLSVSANTALPEGRGPTGIALLENRPVCVNDYQADPSTAPWHGLARQYGWHSAGTFPINRGGRVHAVLSVYHSHTDAFDNEAIALLEEMAGDISFALDNFDKELERERSEQALTESEGRLSAIIENIGSCIYMKDSEGRYLFVNQPVLDLWGVSREEVIGGTDARFFDELTVSAIRDKDLRVLRDGEIVQAEETNRVMGSGKTISYWSVKLPLRRADGSIYAMCGISTDITERKRFEEVQRLNAQVFESSEEGIVITDAANNIVSVNRAWCEITGYAAEEVLGRNPRLLASGQQGKHFYQHMWQEIAGQGHWQGELINRRKNGDFYPQWLSITVIRDEAGRIINHIGIISDLSEHKAREERIEFLSNYDPLTLLPNRALLRDRAELALAGARRSKDRVSLLYIDLDRFKIVNESLGPSIGDQLLKEFSGRLRSQLQADQTLCRQGGDDFILLLPDTDAEAAAHVASTVLESCAQPLFIGKQRLVLTACIGIAVFPEDGQDYEQLTRAADAALFRAKKSGPGSFQFFTPQMHEHASEILQLEGELRQAIEHKQLLLHYQPQFDLASGQLVGAEALVRWQHPDKGLVPPSRFIPLAEESGLIVDIGSWVLHEAIRQNRFWQIEGLPVVPIAVNLSALQFRQSSFYAQVVSALSESGLPPGLLELELTEGIAMEDTEYTVNILAKLHSHGLALAIDDFGIGYSSLSYLKSYTVDTLKIDQSFVQGLGSNSGDEEIINAIIGMARSLGFKTLAEGVETPEQLQYLRERQCDQVQGFLFARPLSAEDFALLLRRGGRMTLV